MVSLVVFMYAMFWSVNMFTCAREKCVFLLLVLTLVFLYCRVARCDDRRFG